MTKSSIWLALLFAAFATADQQLHHTRDRNFILRQEFVHQLFYKPDDLGRNYAEIVERARTFRIEDLRSLPVSQRAANRYIRRGENPGLLPRGRSATAFHPGHLAEIKDLFEVLHSAENFETFALVSVWSSRASNEILWFFAEAVAVLRRRDTRLLRLPNLHESLPQYFYNKDVLRLLGGNEDEFEEATIIANYSRHISQPKGVTDPEAQLTYFTEDVALSDYYFFLVLDAPFFLDSGRYRLPRRRGERYFDDHRQLLARYRLERLSNEVEDVEDLNFNKIVTGFYPDMEDYNGNDFPTRPLNARVQVAKEKYATLANRSEKRLRTAIENHEFSSFNDLMNAVQGNADSADLPYYGSFEILARHILGYAPEPHDSFHVTIGALENYNAGLRDPAFYRMLKKIVGFGLSYKSHLAPYTRRDLNFPEVSLENIRVGRITTYFEDFDSILGEQHQLCRRVRQRRLNHGNFSVELTISARKPVKAMVRLFLGPKFDANGRKLDFESARRAFFQLDQFPIELKPGANEATRRDADFAFQVAETPRSDEFYELIERALDEKTAFGYHEQPYGYPRHLMIPKGRRDGLPLRLLVVVSPIETIYKDDRTIINGRELQDDRPLGFPIDRRIDAEALEVDNLMFEDVVVYHK